MASQTIKLPNKSFFVQTHNSIKNAWCWENSCITDTRLIDNNGQPLSSVSVSVWSSLYAGAATLQVPDSCVDAFSYEQEFVYKLAGSFTVSFTGGDKFQVRAKIVGTPTQIIPVGEGMEIIPLALEEYLSKLGGQK